MEFKLPVSIPNIFWLSVSTLLFLVKMQKAVREHTDSDFIKCYFEFMDTFLKYGNKTFNFIK